MKRQSVSYLSHVSPRGCRAPLAFTGTPGLSLRQLPPQHPALRCRTRAAGKEGAGLQLGRQRRENGRTPCAPGSRPAARASGGARDRARAQRLPGRERLVMGGSPGGAAPVSTGHGCGAPPAAAHAQTSPGASARRCRGHGAARAAAAPAAVLLPARRSQPLRPPGRTERRGQAAGKAGGAARSRDPSLPPRRPRRVSEPADRRRRDGRKPEAALRGRRAVPRVTAGRPEAALSVRRRTAGSPLRTVRSLQLQPPVRDRTAAGLHRDCR